MNQSIDPVDFLKYKKRIIYGAGRVARLHLPILLNFDKSWGDSEIWDINYDKLKPLCGITVQKPDFNSILDFETTAVFIALSFNKNREAVNETEKKFLKAGCKNIFLLEDILSKKVHIDDFVNNAYSDCTYEDDMDFGGKTPLVKPIAFYLPQFHEIPENNEWWGKGFTEWTNTRKSVPRFKGHYQPREPHDDFGYYDLSDPDVIRKQAELAKRHGIYGWAVYYYWFSGKTLLTKPIDLLLANKDIDINFCLTWCNEPWTKGWVGDDSTTLIDNEKHEGALDNFIDDIKDYLLDDRYIKVDGKPLIIIYHAHRIPNPEKTIAYWRNRAKELGIGDIAIFSVRRPYTLKDMSLEDCLDGEMDFTNASDSIPIRLINDEKDEISKFATSYENYAQNYRKQIIAESDKTYRSCMCGFDNSPRYARNFVTHDIAFKKKQLYEMAKCIVDDALRTDKEYIFVFAWNEWAESAYLEPDKRFGYMTINTLSKAIHGLPLDCD